MHVFVRTPCFDDCGDEVVLVVVAVVAVVMSTVLVSLESKQTSVVCSGLLLPVLHGHCRGSNRSSLCSACQGIRFVVSCLRARGACLPSAAGSKI